MFRPFLCAKPPPTYVKVSSPSPLVFLKPLCWTEPQLRLRLECYGMLRPSPQLSLTVSASALSSKLASVYWNLCISVSAGVLASVPTSTFFSTLNSLSSFITATMLANVLKCALAFTLASVYQVSPPSFLQGYQPVCGKKKKKPQFLFWRYVDNSIILHLWCLVTWLSKSASFFSQQVRHQVCRPSWLVSCNSPCRTATRFHSNLSIR